MTTDSAPRTEARWEWMARCIAPLIHDGLLDVPGERQNIDKAFAAAKALDAALPEAEAAIPGPALTIDELRGPIGVVIDRWYRGHMLRFSSRDDGSDDLLLRDEIARAILARLAAPAAQEES